MQLLKCSTAKLAEHSEINARLWIAPVIFRLSSSRSDWSAGHRDLEVQFRPNLKSKPHSCTVRLDWSLAALALEHQYATIQQELARLRSSKNQPQITEEAAMGVAFLLVQLLLPNDRITGVVQIGGRGDFHLNDRWDQMIEISGMMSGDLNNRFREKRSQILLNRSLAKAIVCVSRFAPLASRLERVR